MSREIPGLWPPCSIVIGRYWVSGSYQQLSRAKLIDDYRLSAGDVNAHVTMHAAAFQTDQNSEVDRQPLRICHTQQVISMQHNVSATNVIQL